MERIIPDDIPIVALSKHLLLPRVLLSFHLPRPFYEDIEENFSLEERFLGVLLKNEMSILPIGCVGRIVKAEPLSCGRAFHLDLLGLARFRHRRECFGEGLRQTQIEVLEEKPGTLLPEKKRYLLDTLERLKERGCADPESEANEPDDEAFLNRLCVKADLPPVDKYLLMETGDLNQRCGRLADLLRMKMGGFE